MELASKLAKDGANITSTIEIMEAPAEKIKIRSSYNLAAISFDPIQLANEIKKHIPNFTIDYLIDFRQEIASSWPKSINDKEARLDWGWKHEYNINAMVSDMFLNLRKTNTSFNT